MWRVVSVTTVSDVSGTASTATEVVLPFTVTLPPAAASGSGKIAPHIFSVVDNGMTTFCCGTWSICMIRNCTGIKWEHTTCTKCSVCIGNCHGPLKCRIKYQKKSFFSSFRPATPVVYSFISSFHALLKLLNMPLSRGCRRWQSKYMNVVWASSVPGTRCCTDENNVSPSVQYEASDPTRAYSKDF